MARLRLAERVQTCGEEDHMTSQRISRGKWVVAAVLAAAIFSPALADRAMAQACAETFTADVVALERDRHEGKTIRGSSVRNRAKRRR